MEAIPNAFWIWIVGILMSVVGFFIIRSFANQEKKDQKQDEQIEKINETLEAVKELGTSMRIMIQKHDSEISFLMKNVEKATQR